MTSDPARPSESAFHASIKVQDWAYPERHIPRPRSFAPFDRRVGERIATLHFPSKNESRMDSLAGGFR